MSKIRTLVVDDEPIARARVVSLLSEEADIEVIGECANGQQAMSAIESGSPDLLFLDIQMPEVNGLDLARTIQSTGTPAVVFVTAYDEYALRAFEVHALDFLLKPFSAERFRSALGHAREQVSQRRERRDGAEGRGSPQRRAGTRPNRLMIKSGGRIHFVRMADIDWCEAQGNYVRVHVGPQEHLVRDTMSHLESELDPAAVRADPSIDDRQRRSHPGNAIVVQRRIRRAASHRHPPHAQSRLSRNPPGETRQTDLSQVRMKVQFRSA